MRKLAQASTVLLLGSASTAMASGMETTFGEARLYWRTSFGEVKSQPTASQFGMSLDYDRRYAGQTLPLQPAVQAQFDRAGFVGASVNGLPFARRVTLQQAEGGSDAGSSYTAIDYGLLALGAAGIGYGISEVVNQKDTRDAATPAPPGNPPAPPASPLPLPIPASLSLPLPAPTSLPLPTPTSLSLPIPAPTSLPIPAPFGQTSGAYSSMEERFVTPEYQSWLDAGTGGMGDLVLIEK